MAYKTPWNALPFHLGFVLLAGIGTDFLFRPIRKVPLKVVAGALLGIGLLHLAWQSGQANFRYAADPRNPYVYAQTSSDYLKLVKRVDDVAAVLPRTGKTPDQSRLRAVRNLAAPLVAPPLRPRRLLAGRGRPRGDSRGAALVIASEAQAVRIRPLIEDAFHEEFYGLRPDVLLALFVRNDLWERFLDGRRR